MLEDVIQLHSAGRFEEAERGYRALLASNPDDAEVLQLLGLLRAQQDDVDGGIELLQRAAVLVPDSAPCRYSLGEMYLAQGRLDEAAGAYDEARVLNPNLAGAHVGLGRVALRRGDAAAAESHFKVALRADPNDPQALAGLGNAATARGDSATALRWLAAAAKVAPEDPVTQTSYAAALMDQGMADFAAQALDNALRIRPDYALARVLRADVDVRKGDLAAALPVYQALLARDEQVPMVRTGLGDIARAEGRYDDAIAQYDEALRLQPELYAALLRRSEVLARTGKEERAVGDLRAYLAQYPETEAVHVGFGRLLTRLRRFDAARTAWDEAERRWPDHPDIRVARALALDQAGQVDAAAACAERVATSTDPAIALLRGAAAIRAGHPEAALRRLQVLDAAAWDNAPSGIARRRQRVAGLAFDALQRWPDAVEAFLAAQRAGAGPAAALPALGEPDHADLQRLAALPPLADPQGAPPLLLCGAPGSGVRQVAALLDDQPGWRVRRDRLMGPRDFISPPLDPRLVQKQVQDVAPLAALERQYRRALAQALPQEGVRSVDWIPLLDAWVVPLIQRALPGARLVIVGRDPRDTFLNWLALGWGRVFPVVDATAGARWLRRVLQHLEAAARLLPTYRVDADALLATGGRAARQQLGEFLGVGDMAWGPLARAARVDRDGLPAALPQGHAMDYREALAAAFDALDGA